MTSLSAMRKVGRYEILREIGRGGTAVVYLARQTDLDRNVALKELASFRASDPAFVERFLRESRLTGSLNHPNIVTVYEYFEHDGAPFIAMEYFARGSLRPYIGRLELPQITGVLEGLLAGLAHAESQGIVHRDLKPENVMVTSNGGVKIADFGMAKARELQTAGALTESGTTVGTPAYMAPEQALGARVGPTADLYSLGVIAYELLSGRVPFDQAEAPMAIMLRHLNDPVTPLTTLRPGVDAELAACVEQLLAKEPADRPPSAADAWEMLEEIVIGVLGPRWRRGAHLVDEPASSPAITEHRSRTRTLRLTRALPQRRSRRWLALLALVGVLGAGAAAVGFVVAEGSPSATRTSEDTTSTEPRLQKTTSTQRARGPTLRTIAFAPSGDDLTGSIRLSGRPLRVGSVHVRDGDLSDGRALLLVRQPGITSRVRSDTFGPLSVLVRKGPGVIRIDVAADAGAFTGLSARAVGEHRIVLAIARSQPVRVSGSTTGSTTTTTTGTTSTNTPTERKKKPPPIDTG
jgi:serine/threonine protein kinase